jgi:hypothetical protein
VRILNRDVLHRMVPELEEESSGFSRICDEVHWASSTGGIEGSHFTGLEPVAWHQLQRQIW